MKSTFVDALISSDCSGDIPASRDIYGWLVGSWKVRVLDSTDNGKAKESNGEWHFARVLEGRAIQDVFIVPEISQRSADLKREGNRFGTSLRTYDSETDRWQIRWINPVRGVENRLDGFKAGNEIIQEGRDASGVWMRWCFRDIAPDSFRWTGEQSTDEGKTWQLGAEFFAERIKL